MPKVIKVLLHDDIKDQDVFCLYKYNEKFNLGFSSRVYVSYGYKSKVKGYVFEVLESEEECNQIIESLDEFPILDDLKETLIAQQDYYLVSLYKILSKILPFPKKESPYKTAYYVPIIPTPRDKINKREYDLLQTIKNEGKVKVDDFKKSSSLKTLLDKKYIEVKYIEEENDKQVITGFFSKIDEDFNIIEDIFSSEEKNVLIETNNSYKEDILIAKLCEAVLLKNKSVLIINPRFSSYDPLIELLNLYFENKVVQISIGKNNTEYIKRLKQIKKGSNKIIIGDKHSIFAPINDLDLIILRNSESSEYKDFDIFINYKTTAMKSKYKTILFSSCPSIDIKARQIKGYLSYFDFKNKNSLSYKLIEREKDVPFPKELLTKIKECIDKKEQVIILNTQRGYASTYQCKECKRVAFCPSCGKALTYYKDEEELRCLKCGYVIPLNEYHCETCGSNSFDCLNLGTRGIQDYLQKEFIDGRIARLDYDSVKDRDYQMDLSSFALGDSDVLVGTNGIASQTLLPKVALIIVMDIDWILNVDSYYIEEKYYDILSSLLSSSSENTQAYILTNYLTNRSINLIANQDYNKFYEYTMDKRKLLGAPPYYYLINLVFDSQDYNLLSDACEKIYSYFKDKFKDKRVIILGPNFKKYNPKEHRYIAFFMIKYKSREDVDLVMREFIKLKLPKGITMKINVDPEGE